MAKRALAAANRPKGLKDALTDARYLWRHFAHALPSWKLAQQHAGEMLSLGEVRRLARQVRRTARAGIAA